MPRTCSLAPACTHCCLPCLSPAPPLRPAAALKGNWEAFWAAVGRDHSHAGLVWNEGTRAELREALQAEEGALRLARLRGADAGGASLAWNHEEFRVAYPSLRWGLLCSEEHWFGGL